MGEVGVMSERLGCGIEFGAQIIPDSAVIFFIIPNISICGRSLKESHQKLQGQSGTHACENN